MQVIDVMRRLNSENEIRFLLTAYLETLRGVCADKRLPPGVAALPIRDAADVGARFRQLLNAELCGLASSHCDTQGAIAHEATAIFGAAFMRLQAMQGETTAEEAMASAEGEVSSWREREAALV